MKEIFVNLKRFEVARELGGICPLKEPKQWVETVIDETVKLGIGSLTNLKITFLFPEALLINAFNKINSYPSAQISSLAIGCQGVFREDILASGNFGAFTTNRPATAMKSIGCQWSIIGHSEERKDKLGIMAAYDSAVFEDGAKRDKAKKAVDGIINAEVVCALRAGLDVLLCVGETAEEKGGGLFEEQKPRIEAVLRSQLEMNLKGVAGFINNRKIVIGYEPVWAIGPGKIPPGVEYISFVSSFIKKTVAELDGFVPAVVYGGGLKEDNAALIGGIQTIDGGLVALTRFSGEIGFEPSGLKRIIDQFSSY